MTVVELNEAGPLNSAQKELLRRWLFVNQMFYAADWVSRSGGFVKHWPQSANIFPTGFNVPDLTDHSGYFDPNNATVLEALENENEATEKRAKEELQALNVLGAKKMKKKLNISSLFQTSTKRTEAKPNNDTTPPTVKAEPVKSTGLFGTCGVCKESDYKER